MVFNKLPVNIQANVQFNANIWLVVRGMHE
jgi:hypothetical protein